ncbi:unnamed protein product, partial [marine sediment metagenome]
MVPGFVVQGPVVLAANFELSSHQKYYSNLER